MMFKTSATAEQPSYSRASIAVGSTAPLATYCSSEEWSADLQAGTIRIGLRAAAMHGLAARTCGLITLARAYPAPDRSRIIGLFEQAAATPFSFCYAASVRLDDDRHQPVFCMAGSTELQEGSGLSLTGIFLFPRVTLEEFRTSGPHSLFA